ncbi:unnamed protein product [Protopolystoma xenopodis]|uniref:Uncharacterized protein n=1 Tax=Protopolystoma xenopodis TaxID=117903 RepID=A0A3S5AJA0_9PLAT|nr:unnamed protein product [Protopolystoma xenopodis]
MNSEISNQSLDSYSSIETISGVNLDILFNAQVFTRTGIHKGNIVALKPLHRQSITPTKRIMIEVKKVRATS